MSTTVIPGVYDGNAAQQQALRAQGLLMATNTFSTASPGLGAAVYLTGTTATTIETSRPPRVIALRRLKELIHGPYEWVDFVQEETGDWRVVQLVRHDGTIADYSSLPRTSTILTPPNDYLPRLLTGEGVHGDGGVYQRGGEPVKGQETSLQATKEVKEEKHQIYTKLQEKVQKIEQILGLSGEVKNPVDLLSALAERVQEIEDYLENRP